MARGGVRPGAGSGGKRPGAGRPKGAKDKANAEKEQAIAASGLTPLDYMLGLLRDEGLDRETRLDAAKSAAPYCHARLQQTNATISAAGALEDALKRIVGV